MPDVASNYLKTLGDPSDPTDTAIRAESKVTDPSLLAQAINHFGTFSLGALRGMPLTNIIAEKMDAANPNLTSRMRTNFPASYYTGLGAGVAPGVALSPWLGVPWAGYVAASEPAAQRELKDISPVARALLGER